jgi:tripartite-type tricarboxylate transporter receptor subunit TctC
MWAPAGTPGAVVQKLNATVNAIVQEPPVREQFAKLGMQPAPMKPEEFARFVRAEIEVYKRIVKQAGIEPQ